MTDAPADLTAEPALPELDPAEEERLATALKHAFAPGEIDAERHERLLSVALEDPFAPPSEEELVESDRLRRALDGEASEHHNPELALARALAAAHASTRAPLPELVRSPLPSPAARGGKVLYLRFGGAAAALAVAAALALSVGSRERSAPAPDLATLALVQSRSTAALFQAASAGPPSSRIDRIASVRERELRGNRYALWGIR